MEETLTRIILKHKPSAAHAALTDSTRTPREVIKAVNTGALVIGAGAPGGPRQWARYDSTLQAVLVSKGPPLAHLTSRQYDILFHLADGDTTAQTAYSLGISLRTVYTNIAEMKRRLRVMSRAQMVARAHELGLVGSIPENHTYYQED